MSEDFECEIYFDGKHLEKLADEYLNNGYVAERLFDNAYVFSRGTRTFTLKSEGDCMRITASALEINERQFMEIAYIALNYLNEGVCDE